MTSDAMRPGGRGIGDRVGAGGIDIIVPVYGAPEALERCLSSLERHVDRSRHRLLLVVDGPQEEAVERLVARARERFGAPALDVLRQEVRSGYPAAIHRGLLAGEVESGGTGRDVVLLNSDTVVTRCLLYTSRCV